MGNECAEDAASQSGDGPHDAGVMATDAGSVDASGRDGGPGIFCSSVPGPDGGCLCDYSGSIDGLACSTEGASCGVGCKAHCACEGGRWSVCITPPCAPPLPDF